ncbi:MAG: hypothetical protein HeimC3_44470 [Candidatus Heimdallarchaeota archaeon LC_3]|nr:MAG: hypothetical protein HeimC3_44470 [Candidatus Heimdallarchaeota archaeon LC_3]
MPGTASKEIIELCEKNSKQYGKSCLMGHRKLTGIGRFFNLHNFHGFAGKWNKVPKQMS